MAKQQNNQALAIVGLLVNVLVLPGLGSIIGGRHQEGIWQLSLCLGSLLLGILLIFTIVGILVAIPLLIFGPLAAWIWSLVTGIRMVQESN